MRIAGVLLLALLVGPFLLPGARADVTIQEPGFTFTLTGGFANVTFAQTQTFTNWSLPNDHTVCFNTVCLSVQKYPAAYPSVTLNVFVWSPATVSPGQAAARFLASAPAGSSVWFNLSNMINGMPYTLKVDNQTTQKPAASNYGNLGFSWTSWSTHQFEIDVRQNLPVGGQIACTTTPVFLFTTLLSCPFPSSLGNWTAFAWRVNGQSFTPAPVLNDYVTSLQFNASYVLVNLVSLFGNATNVHVASAQLVPLDTTPAAAIGWGAVFLFLLLGIVAFANRTPLPSPHNPTYREEAIKVSFFPDRSPNPNWVSYRRHDPGRYVRFTSRHRNGLWIVYGIRKDGKSEIQTVREPVEDAPKAWVRRALQDVPAPMRDDMVKRLYARGVDV